MGSGQSSNSPPPSSFSVDPSGNVRPRRNSNDVRANKNHDNDDSSTKENKIDMESQLKQQDTNMGDLVNLKVASSKRDSNANINNDSSVISQNHPPHNGPNNFTVPDLLKAEESISKIREKYNLDESSSRRQRIFEDMEQQLIHCYATNKGQPLNCSNIYKQYRDRVNEERQKTLRQASRLNSQLFTTVTVILICLLLHISAVSCFGAMSIDMGHESMKVGLVSSSTNMDLVLNAQSQRKTFMAIAFLNGDRYVGDPAMEIASKYPKKAFTHFLDLVGKTIDDESVQQYKRRFPHANIISHQPNSSSILLNHPEGLSFTPLELITMMIQHAHDQVANSLQNQDEVITDVVITVPPFFGSKERGVIEDAIRLAGLNLLRLTNVNSAFALSYGIFRHRDYVPESSENKTTLLFFDQGAATTSVTLVDYFLVDQFDETTGLKKEALPTIFVRAQVHDRFLGGLDMQLNLRDHLIKAFSKQNNIKESEIYKRPRSVSKFYKEAGRIKKVLSANTDHTVRIESVIEDKDFSMPISRKVYEDMNHELMNDRVVRLLDSLFQMPNVSQAENLESIMIVGGNTRTPRIQQVLKDYFKVDSLGKSINADEGAALAALYQAAGMSRGFRVRKFLLVEFGEQIKRFDPSTITTTTTTTEAPSSETPSTEIPVTELPVTESTSTEIPLTEKSSLEASSNETSAPGVQNNTSSVPTETESPTSDVPDILSSSPLLELQKLFQTPKLQRPKDAIYSQAELDRISEKLTKLAQQDYERMQRLSLRNSIESLLSKGRDRLGDEILKDNKDEIEKVIEDTSAWLEDGPNDETNNISILIEKQTMIHSLIYPKPTPSPETTTTTTTTTSTTTTTMAPTTSTTATTTAATEAETVASPNPEL